MNISEPVRAARFLATGAVLGLLLSACARGPVTTSVPAEINDPTQAETPVVAGQTESAEPIEERPKRLFGFLRGKGVSEDIAIAATPPETLPEVPQTAVVPPSLTDTGAAVTGLVAAGTAEPSRRPRVFGFLAKRSPAEVASTDAPDGPPAMVQTPPDPSLSLTDEEIAAAGPVASDEPAQSRRPRLFGFLQKREPREVATGSGDAGVILAAAPPPGSDSRADPPRAGRGLGLFGGRRAATPPAGSANGPSPEGSLPFGAVAIVCDVRPRDLGREVDRAQAGGPLKLYDSDPASTALRNHYLTGFKDGCARQFSAALVLFGSPEVHEATRYAPENDTDYSATDRAYEGVKNRLCGVRRGQFCPEERAIKLAREAAFVTAYPSFGDADEWLEIFLSNRQLVAYQTQSR